jgi:AsmA protein
MARHARRLILWTTAVLLSLAVLATLGIALLVWGVDPDVFRARIERAATQALGRRVELTGSLRWRPGLNFQIESSGGRIANAEGFGTAPLASWKMLRMGVALRPLLDHRLQVDRIEVQGLRLELMRGSNAVNWKLSPATAAQADSTMAFSIGRLVLRDGFISFTDQHSGSAWSADSLSLDVELPTQTDAPVLKFPSLSLRARLRGAPLQAEGIDLQVSVPALDLDRRGEQLHMPQGRIQWNETVISGSLDAGLGDAGIGAASEARAMLRVDAPSLRRLLQSVSVVSPATVDPSALGPLKLQTQVQAGRGAIALTQLDARLDSTRVQGKMTLAARSPASLSFELAADQVEMDRYLTPEDQPGTPLSLPLAKLRSLDARGVLTIRRATLAGAAAREMRIDVD